MAKLIRLKETAADKKREASELGSIIILMVVFAVIGLAVHLNRFYHPTSPTKQVTEERFKPIVKQVKDLEDRESKAELTVVNDKVIQDQIREIRKNITQHDYQGANAQIDTLAVGIRTWKVSLDSKIASRDAEERSVKDLASIAAKAAPASLSVPILLYHHPPSDFENQLQVLQQRGYTSIDLDQLVKGLAGAATLPAKPVVITFDDGYSDQMNAFSLLQKYKMKATYYIITGGQASGWCFGPNRTNMTCGEPYLSWDQILQLDHSGLITIASHTVDHRALADYDVATQHFEVFASKAELEQHLKHPVHHFAYPYGSLNASAVDQIRQAGYLTAVTTEPGTVHSYGGALALSRIRSVYGLP